MSAIGTKRTLAFIGAVLFSVADWMLPFGFHAQRRSDLLVRLCFVFDGRFHDPRFAGPIEAEHNCARGGDRTAFAVDHGVNGHDERAILLPLFRFLPVQIGDMREFFTVLEPFRDVRLGQVRQFDLSKSFGASEISIYSLNRMPQPCHQCEPIRIGRPEHMPVSLARRLLANPLQFFLGFLVDQVDGVQVLTVGYEKRKFPVR